MSKENLYTGVKVIDNFEHLNELYLNGHCSLDKVNEKLYPNQNLVLKCGQKQSALAVVKNGRINLILENSMRFFGVTPKNKEQKMAMDMLNDTNINLKMITGKEGCGKNYITAAVILDLLLEQKKYNKLILTKTTDEVGKSMGLFPGSSDEKFSNYMLSFQFTFSNLMSKNIDYFNLMLKNRTIEYVPIQLMRGVSFPKGTIVWADEVAGLSPFELRMLGTRLEDDSALVLTGSFEQIDRTDKRGQRNRKEDTGLWKLINSELVKESSMAGSIELIKNERSELSKLISDVL